MQTIYCNLRVRVQNAEEESRKRCRNSIENAVKGQGEFESRKTECGSWHAEVGNKGLGSPTVTI